MTRFLLRRLKIFGSLCILSSAAMASGVYDITIIPSIGPSIFSATSYAGYVGNAVQAIENGSTSNGTVGTPAYYYASNGSVDMGTVIETPFFNSWLGSEALATGNYSGEYGNNLYFGVKITSSTQFDLNQISFLANFLGYPIPVSFAGDHFSAAIVGINTVTGTTYDQNNPGSPTTLINTLYTSGAATYQQLFDPADLAAYIDWARNSGISPVVTGTYTVSGMAPAIAGSNVIHLEQGESVPEPSTFPLLLLGCGAIGFGKFGRKFLAGRLG